MKVSYLQITGAESCPNIVGLPICYIVTIGYGLMFLALLLSIPVKHISTPVFLSGWAITFLIALSGTALEIINGHTCPIGFGWLPLCYVSLALCILIFGLFKWTQKSAQVT